MNDELRFGRRVAGLLSERNAQLDPDVLARLAAGRRRAVAAAGSVTERVQPGAAAWWGVARPALALVLVLGVLFAGDYAGTAHRVAVQGEVETALLADDLPIDAYLDQGFRAWLQQESSASRS